VAAWVGKGCVGGASAAEFGVHLNNAAYIDHQHKGRAAFRRWQRAGIVFALGAGAQQAVVIAFGVFAGFECFGLQHKMAALIAVDTACAGAAVPVGEGDGALEHVVLLGGRVGLGNV
jgi:hypothetical protein